MISAAGKDLKRNLLSPNEISKLAESSWCTRLHPRGWEGVKNYKTDAPAGKKQARGNPNMFKHGGQRAEPSEVP